MTQPDFRFRQIRHSNCRCLNRYDEYPLLVFYFKGKEEVKESDYITKFLNAEILQKDSTYHLEISKYFVLSNDKNDLCSISLLSPIYDSNWVPGSRMTIKNARLKVDYAK